jgi:hypothetical protein
MKSGALKRREKVGCYYYPGKKIIGNVTVA